MHFHGLTVNLKLIVILIFSALLLVLELYAPASVFISKPFAYLVYLLMAPLLPVTLAESGTTIIISSFSVDFIDACTGLPYIMLVALFLWLRNLSGFKIAIVASALFFFNILRVVVVSISLYGRGYSQAASIHNVFYLAFTVLVAILIVYSIAPLLKKEGRLDLSLCLNRLH